MKTEKLTSSVGLSKTILNNKRIIYFSKQAERRLFLGLVIGTLVFGYLVELYLF